MNATEPGVALGQAYRALHSVGQELQQQAVQLDTAQLTTLQRVVESLGHGSAMRPRRCPAAYVLEWQEYQRAPQRRLSSRMVRYLCWEPTVALDPAFQTYLDAEFGTLSTAMLQGLVWCCHDSWSPAFASSPVVQHVQQRLLAYRGDSWLVLYWQQHPDVLLDPSGPRALGRSLLDMRVPIAELCRAWGLDERSAYTLMVLREATDQCFQEMERDVELCTYLVTTLLPWSGWTPDDFRVAVAAVLLRPVIEATPGLPEQVTKLVLADARLGDPRLAAFLPNWAAMPEAARLQFVQWLTIADLNFFFDQVLPESKDQEERKAFWLLYAPRVLRSRVLLQPADITRLRVILRQCPEAIRHFGCIQDAASTLILDLGELIVVQVNDVEEPCYLYGKRSFNQLVPDFWQSEPLTSAALLVESHAATIPHDKRWEREVGEIFAQYSIRAAYKEAA